MTSSTDFLVDDAYRKVWCSPGQDRQYIVAPGRITKQAGDIGNVKIGLKQYNLPTPRDWYDVFAIGDLPPKLVGMDTIVEKWVNVRAHCINTSLLVDLYTNAGVHFPVHRAYFLYTRNGGLLIAFKRTRTIVNLGVVQPFIRWRSNAWFDGAPDVPINKGIEIEGIEFTTQDAFSTYQQKWRLAKQAKGYAWAFVNGRRVKDINVTTAKLGDILEYVRDASVKEVLEIPIKTLRTFDSVLDTKGKYLLPRAGLGTVIDFDDDIDLYILNYKLAAAYDGIYYHQNQKDAVRMVTHRDYAVPTAYLRGYVEGQPTWIWNDDLRVEIIVRNSGWIRPLVDEAHRIKELFKLAETDRLNAMLSIPSSVSVWRAAELENSNYTKVMAAEDGTITRPMVESAYGYNAISRLIGDTPFKIPTDGNRWVKLPYSLTQSSTVYEYDRNGLLLGWYIHDSSIEYPVVNPNTVYIEPYVGRGGLGICTVYDQLTSTINANFEYRFYVCDIRNGVSQNNWRDITGDATFYTVANGQVTWNVALTRYHIAVKSDLNFLAHTLNLDYRDDLLTFTVRLTEIRTGLVPVDGVMDIPPGELDVFLNGYGLIEGLDYYVQWPEVCIVNKAYLVAGTKQRVDIRGRGFCNTDLSRNLDREWGFVEYQKLSHNARFNVRDDKVSRIIIGGALYTRDEVKFSEDGLALVPQIQNGSPYQISHPIIPMMGVTDQHSYALRDISLGIDKEVEDFLTAYLPQPVETLPDGIPGWYPVFSPFAAKLIFDMLNGILTMDEYLRQDYSDDYLRERLSGYDWILAYDPAIIGVNEQNVVIHPHPETEVISLNVYQYRLLDRAIRIFLDNKVLLNRHLVIVEEGFEHDQRDHPHPHRTYAEVGEV